MLEQFKKSMQALLLDQYDDFEKALLEEPIKGLYFNDRYPLPMDLIERYHLEKHHYVENGYLYDYHQYPLGRSPYFDCGLYYIQEPSAMIVASVLDIEEGDRILDLCAAPGGKTCYVASKLHGSGIVIANDISYNRATILSENVERFGLTNTIVTSVPASKLVKQFPEYFDKIIVDAPCSGEGMFRKLDQAVDTWSMDKVEQCASIQKELIQQAYDMLKPGGQLVYSTCTYEKMENEDIILSLLESHDDMMLIPIDKQNGMVGGIDMPEAVRLYPHLHQGEGQFIAKLVKEGNAHQAKVKLARSNIKKNDMQLLSQFYKQYLNIPVPDFIYDNHHHLYALPNLSPDTSHLQVLRNGLYLGEIKKNRFEPGYSLARTLNIKDVKQYYQYSVDSREIQQYLKGEAIEGTNQKGYGVIFVDEYPLSFYKESSHQAKNLFPKGLRKKY